jgi:transcriptional antiterminator RfaH
MDGAIGSKAVATMPTRLSSPRQWYVLQTHPSAEYRVRRWLEPEDAPLDRPDELDGAAGFVSRPCRVRIDPMVARDFRSQRQLDRQGYELWLPECAVIKSTRTSRLVSYRGPWFPGYLFIRLDLSAGWRGLEEVDGVAGLLLDDGRPRALADERIAGLRGACDAQTGLATIAAPVKEYAPGQKMRILSGPFAGFDALYCMREDERIKAMLTLLGHEIQLPFTEAQLEAV